MARHFHAHRVKHLRIHGIAAPMLRLQNLEKPPRGIPRPSRPAPRLAALHCAFAHAQGGAMARAAAINSFALGLSSPYWSITCHLFLV